MSSLFGRRARPRLGGDLVDQRGELKVDQAKPAVRCAVRDVAQFRIVVPHAKGLEFREEGLHPLLVELVDV